MADFNRIKKGVKRRVNNVIKIVNPDAFKSPVDENAFRVLLLTNRDSDNIGDQVIEASDIGIISAVMKNLNIVNYKIESRAAAIVTQKYLSTKNDALLEGARNAISNSDLVVFGGAPMFNYLYQNFYERTAVTLELAQEYNKPVIFSAIGVESYDEDNKKCQRLKKTLNFDCVKQITTRDGFERLEKYKEKEDLYIAKVSDPAVFSASVLRNYASAKNTEGPSKIGIFVLRSNGFKDNKVDFSRDDAADLWKNLAKELENSGYDYEFLTSGHFGDEAFMEHLIDNCGIDASKCVFNMNTPEDLFRKISSYDAVVSTRLHPSIISFSADVPSVGIVWNNKVKKFYESIGYSDRVIEVKDLTAKNIVDKLGNIISEGVKKNPEYLMTVYNTLFDGIKSVMGPEYATVNAYTYEELLLNMPQSKGTSKKEKNEKLKRKFKRTYKKYNELFEKNLALKEQVQELKNEIAAFK